MSSRRAPARWQSPWPFYAGRRIEDQRRTRRTVTKLRLKAPSKTEPRQSERIFVTRRPFGPQLRQLLKPNTCLNRTDIGFRRCLSHANRDPELRQRRTPCQVVRIRLHHWRQREVAFAASDRLEPPAVGARR